MKFELMVALRYLKSKQKERFISIITVISVFGVAVGVAALIIVLAVMNGFDKELKEKVISANPHIIIQKEGGISDVGYATGVIEEVPGVVSSSPFVRGQAMVRYEDSVMGVLVRGIDPEGEVRTTRIASYLKKGSLDLTGKKIVIGSEYSKKFRVGVGDELSVISPQTGRAYDFKISGIFQSGMYEYDLNLVLINLKNGQMLFNTGKRVTGIGVKVDDEFRVKAIKGQIQAALGYPFWTMSWIDLNKNLFSALKLEKTVMFIIVFLIVLVACFNIASTLIMIVLEKVKDIGILKAIGATRKSVAGIFAWQGFLIGFSGTVLGLGLGVLLCYLLREYQFVKLPNDIYYIDKIPVVMKTFDTVIIAAGAFILSLATSIYPAYAASRLEPVEAIRYE